jgi:hypothetical protein
MRLRILLQADDGHTLFEVDATGSEIEDLIHGDFTRPGTTMRQWEFKAAGCSPWPLPFPVDVNPPLRMAEATLLREHYPVEPGALAGMGSLKRRMGCPGSPGAFMPEPVRPGRVVPACVPAFDSAYGIRIMSCPAKDLPADVDGIMFEVDPWEPKEVCFSDKQTISSTGESIPRAAAVAMEAGDYARAMAELTDEPSEFERGLRELHALLADVEPLITLYDMLESVILDIAVFPGRRLGPGEVDEIRAALREPVDWHTMVPTDAEVAFMDLLEQVHAAVLANPLYHQPQEGPPCPRDPPL